MTKGKRFERFVAFLEGLELPDGFKLEHNKRIKGPGGADEAEFDILISGSVGSADFRWLIECRDRPSSPAAPAAWIEQLVGRRDRFNFNKVTAVSTSPFSQPATRLASQKGIDLRVVKSMSPEEFSSWLIMRQYRHSTNFADLQHVQIIVPEHLEKGLDMAMSERCADLTANEAFLVANDDGNCRPADVFREIASNNGLFEGLVANGPKKRVRIVAQFPDNADRYRIATHAGSVGIEQMEFTGELFCVEEFVPLDSVSEYQNACTGVAISQTATFGAIAINDASWALRLVRNVASDVTSVLLVRTDGENR